MSIETSSPSLGVQPSRCVIGVTGLKGCGKSEFTNALTLHESFTRVHPATPIREMLVPLLQAFNYDASTIAKMLDGSLKRRIIPELGRTPTELQQTLGTEWGRNLVKPDLWTDLWRRKARLPHRVINDSVRFENEAQMILSENGWLIHVHRPGLPMDDTHPSEHYARLLPVHYVIINSGTVEHLHKIALEFFDWTLSQDPAQTPMFTPISKGY